MNKNDTLITEIITLSKKLIAIPSTANNLGELHTIIELVKTEFERIATVDRFESNGVPSLLIHNQKPNTKQFKIILNAHLDVVPGKADQYSAFEENGKLYGRGAYDMKSAAAVMIVLFKEILQEINYPIALQIVTDEESGSQHTTKHQIEKGIRGEFVICGECGSDMEIVHKAKGGLWIILKAQGKPAHGGYPWRGENALWKLQEVLQDIKRLYPVPMKEEWITTVNLSKIHTVNEAFNAVPDEAVAHLDVRFVHEDKNTIIENIKQIIPKDISIEIVQNTLPTFVSEDNQYVTFLKLAIEKIIKQEPKIKVAHATSDIRFYNEVGCLGVEFGPVGKHQHADNEYVEIKSLEEYYYTLKNFLLAIR